MEKQIQKQEVMDLLLKACPSYMSRWEDYKKVEPSHIPTAAVIPIRPKKPIAT
jgi:hypothetical protein